MFEKTQIIEDEPRIFEEISSPFFVVSKVPDETSFVTLLQPEPETIETDTAAASETSETISVDADDSTISDQPALNHNIALEQGRKPQPLSLRQRQMRAIILQHRTERAQALERKKSFRQRLGAIGLAFGVTVAGVQFLPPALGQPTVESTIGRAIEGGIIDQVGGPQIYQQAAEQAEVDHLTPNAFIIKYADRLKNIRAGDTFIPEQWLPSNVNAAAYSQTAEGQLYQQKVLSVLEAEVENLGVDQIRLGIRWQNTLMPDGSFSLAFYQPYLNFLTSYKNPVTGKGVQVLLGVGPLKSPGWPESFVPPEPANPAAIDTSLIPLGKLPKDGAVISPETPDTDLIEKSERWLSLLMQNIATDYSPINYFQLDNEFVNPFGTEEWTMSAAWEKKLAEIVLQYQKNASFMINFAGTANIAGSVDIKNPPNLVKAIGETVMLLQLEQKFSEKSVISEMLSYRNALLSGIKSVKGKGSVAIGMDYYNLTSNTPLPIKEKVDGKTYEVYVDTQTLIKVTENLAGDKNPWAKLQNEQVPVVDAEVQAEPWQPYTSPGNDPKELLLVIRRNLDVLPTNQPTTMGFWQLSPIIYRLMYDPKHFYSNADPKKMSDPTGQYTANNQAVLEIVAAMTGVSSIKTVDDKKVVDNSKIDSFINQYVQTANSGLNISTP